MRRPHPSCSRRGCFPWNSPGTPTRKTTSRDFLLPDRFVEVIKQRSPLASRGHVLISPRFRLVSPVFRVSWIESHFVRKSKSSSFASSTWKGKRRQSSTTTRRSSAAGLGLDSLDALQLAMAIEERYQVTLPEGDEVQAHLRVDRRPRRFRGPLASPSPPRPAELDAPLLAARPRPPRGSVGPMRVFVTGLGVVSPLALGRAGDDGRPGARDGRIPAGHAFRYERPADPPWPPRSRI